MPEELRNLALEIWRAGVDAVSSEALVRRHVSLSGNHLAVAGHDFDLRMLDRIVVVGAGKAGAGMAEGIEEELKGSPAEQLLTGLVNVPADCVRPLRRIELHAARPAGINEPTEAGVEGTRRILDLVAGLTDRDLCLVLISGGGSALLPAPVKGVSLAAKQFVTRLLMLGGATIQELNTVRKQLSAVKGGGLARTAHHGTVISLIISDVIGDPLDIIASGPTVDDPSTPEDALRILRRIAGDISRVPSDVVASLERAATDAERRVPLDSRRVFNHVIGNNQAAVDAAAGKAGTLGLPVLNLGSGHAGVASDLGKDLADLCLSIRDRNDPRSAPVCILSGGEPVVHLADTPLPRRGGRNQEVALAACVRLAEDDGHRLVILSGGTDGEDGPTDAAGAWVDSDVLAAMRARQLDPDEFLAVNNSYPFFDATGGLLKTGPTHTNVMDLRVAVVQAPC